MSIRAWGKINLMGIDMPVEEEIELSFALTIVAAKNRIGVKLGGNVSQHIRRELGELASAVPFELMDDPLDVNAHCLFMADGVPVVVGNTRADTGESLATRIGRVEGFFRDVLKNEVVQNVELFLAIEDDEFGTLQVRLDDFSSTILQLYTYETHWAPSVKLIISR